MANDKDNKILSCFISPDWPAPSAVKAYTTTRRSPVENYLNNNRYAGFNLATHVEDDPEVVKTNRETLKAVLNLPVEPLWLEQIHSDKVIEYSVACVGAQADAIYAKDVNSVCVVQTADCLPVLLCNRAGTVVAAVHAGWRGLQQNIIRKTLAAMNVKNDDVLAWLGPAIGVDAYEVDEQVYSRFMNQELDYDSAFTPTRPGHWLMDLYAIARIQLRAAGTNAIYGGGFCTFKDKERFYSFRRDGKTDRMASLIWLSK